MSRKRSPTSTWTGVLAEAFANVISRPLASCALALLAASLLLTAFVAETNSAAETSAYESSLIASGYSTLLLERQDDALQPLKTADCTSLEPVPGVVAVVSLREPEPRRLWGTAGPELPIRPIGGEVIDFLAAADPNGMEAWSRAQVFVDRESSAASVRSDDEYDLILADPTGVSTARALRVELTALGAGATGNAVNIDNREGNVSACALFVGGELREEVVNSVDVAFPAVLGFSHRWVMSNADKFDSPTLRYERRPSQYYWVGFALVFAAFWMLNLRNRRAEYALYAILGLSRMKVSLLATAELIATLLLGLSCFLVVSGVGVIFHDSVTRYVRIGFVSTGRSAVAAFLLGVVGCCQVAGRTTSGALEAIKDR